MRYCRFQAQEILEKFDSETRMRKAQAEQQRAMQTVLQQSGETPQDRFPASQRNSLENGSLLRLLVFVECLIDFCWVAFPLWSGSVLSV